MGRIEVITLTERRRKYSPAERHAIMREADAPDVTVREVAKRHDIAESLIYSWRTARRQAEKIASEPLTFISYGAVPHGAVAIWGRPILKRDAFGIHGTLFYDNEQRRDHIPPSKREVDWDNGSVNQAQRDLFAKHR